MVNFYWLFVEASMYRKLTKIWILIHQIFEKQDFRYGWQMTRKIYKNIFIVKKIELRTETIQDSQ
jgi:hypothetical protein